MLIIKIGRPFNFVVGKAYRKKQGEGVVSYVEPLLRNNAVFGNFSKTVKSTKKTEVEEKFSKTRRTHRSSG